MNAVLTLRRAGSVARVGRLLDQGVKRHELATLIRSGAIIRPRRGILALPDASDDLLAAVTQDALLTCSSAARFYDLWLLNEPTSHHIHSHARPVAPCIGHHRPLSVPVHARLPVVGLVDVLVHALHCLPPVEAAVMVEGALRRGDTIKVFLLDRLRGNRNGRARAVLDLVTGFADSPLEVKARIMFIGAGIDVQEQVQVNGVGRVDFVLEGFLVVEMDGDAFHSDRQARRRDRRRSNATVIGGYLGLRYGYEDIMFHADDVLAEVMAVLRGRPLR